MTFSQSKTAVFIVCGKSPTTSHGGGYSAYTGMLKKNLTDLGIDTQIVASESKVTALPYLPFYSIVFALKILKLCKNSKYKNVIIWGVGPWGFAGVLAKPFINNSKLISSYFTTIKHESRGALSAINIRDYGTIIKLKYLIAYYTLIQILSMLEMLTLNSSEFIFASYKSTENIITEEFKIPKNKFVRTGAFLQFPIPPGLVKSSAARWTKKLPSNFILTICRQDARKGINFYLHALKLLKDKNIKYNAIIIGDGEMLTLNNKLARKLKLGSSVQFLSYQPNTSIFLRKCSTFCFPTVEEGSSAFSLLEAMEAGVPIVSTNVDGIAEDLRDDFSALLVPPKNPKALADALEKLISNTKLAKKLGENAKKEYIKKYNQKKVKQELKELIRKL